MRTLEFGHIIPTYNDSGFFPEHIASLVGQTVKPDIVTIVNDGSDEEHTEQIDYWADVLERHKIKTQVLHKPNTGVFDSLNYAIERTDSVWVNTFPVDDVLLAEYWQEVLESGGDADVVVIGYKTFGEENGLAIPPRPKTAVDSLRHLQKANYICGLSPFRKELWKKIGGFQQNLSPIADYAFWIDAALHDSRFYHSKKPLAKVRVRSNSLWQTQRHREKPIIARMLNERGLA